MSLFVDLKYVNTVSHLLRNFRKKADYLWNYSCPICGDSRKNKLKARGYLVRWKDGLFHKCHNCGCSMSFGELLKNVDPSGYKQYVYDTFLEEKGGAPKQEEKPVFKPKKSYAPVKPTVLIGCPSISTLGTDHPARQYIESRQLPEKFLKEIFWCEDFPALAEKVCVDHQFNLKKEGRIIIPFLDANYKLVAIQGRSLEKNAVRYITIKAFEDAPRIYGLHRLGKIWKRIYIVEGPFDSMFLPNCLAMAGSDIPVSLPIDRVLVAYDNEPRKKETCDKIEAAINKGYRVCIWPSTIKEKDINDMVKAGYEADKIRTLIDRNSYVGLEAKFRLQQWRKA